MNTGGLEKTPDAPDDLITDLPVLSDGLELTDQGNGARIVKRYEHILRFVHDMKMWFIWDGSRWVRDRTQRVAKLAVQAVLPAEVDGEFKKKSLDSGRVNAALKRAATWLGVVSSDLDAHPWLLNVQGGTIDLKSGAPVAPNPDHLMTLVAGTHYDPEADCPQFKAFLHWMFSGDVELIDFIRRFMGYMLTGSAAEQVFLFFYGNGGNGKSVLFDVMEALLGEYASRASAALFVGKSRASRSGPDPFLRHIKGARLIVGSEIEKGEPWNEALLKDLTGGDVVIARALNHGPVEFRPEGKIVLYGNAKPWFKSANRAMRRRLRLMPCDAIIADDAQDGELGNKLKQELPGILNFALDGLADYLASGLGQPASVREATDQYFGETDSVGRFLNLDVVREASARTSKGELFTHYEEFCERESLSPVSAKSFGTRILQMGFRDSSNGKTRFWHGLRPSTSAAADEVAADTSGEPA